MEFEAGLVVKAIYPFNGEEEGDLSFNEGESILVIDKVNNEWLRGQVNGKTGIFPCSFVERLGIQTTSAIYNFYADCKGDLGVTVDEKLIVKSIVNNEWVCVVNQNRCEGNVPRNHLSEFSIDIRSFLNEAASREDYFSNINSFGLNNNTLVPAAKSFDIPVTKNATPGEPPSFNCAIASATNNCNNVNDDDAERYSYFVQSTKSSPLVNGFGSQDAGMRRAVSTFFGGNMIEQCGDSNDFENTCMPNNASVFTRSSSNPDINKDITSGNDKLRLKAINEIINTEKIFSNDLDLFMEFFSPSDLHWKSLKIPYGEICCNLDEIQVFSKRLLTELNRAKLSRENFGGIFLEKSKEMFSIYTKYCTNFENVPKLIEQLSLNKDINSFFEYRIRLMKERGSKILNMNSFLLQPVQRLMRYPLLLNELLKHTPNSHHDKRNLSTAVSKLQQIVENVNQSKRTKEVVERYKSAEPNNIKSALCKLNMHTIMKKSGRLSQSVTRKITSPLVEDSEFEKCRSGLKSLEKCINSFEVSVSSYNRTLASFSSSVLGVLNEMSNFLLEKFSEKSLYRNHQSLCMKLKDLTSDHVKAVQANVVRPSNKLLDFLTGPSHLIKKRDDKLLDYERLLSEAKVTDEDVMITIESSNSVLYTAKGNYSALNDQLKQELPQLNSLVRSSIKELCLCLLKMRHKFLKNFGLHYQSYCRHNLAAIAGTHKDFKIVFERKHKEISSQISARVYFLPDTFSVSTITLEGSPQRLSGSSSKKKSGAKKHISLSNQSSFEEADTQTEAVKQKLRTKYTHGDLYVCKALYRSSKLMHLTLNTGDLVGVKHRKDQTGNENIWVVDNGSIIGLVETVFLTPVFPTTPFSEHNPVVLRQRNRSENVESNRRKERRPVSLFVEKSSSNGGLLSPVYLPEKNFDENRGNQQVAQWHRLSTNQINGAQIMPPSHNNYTRAPSRTPATPNQISPTKDSASFNTNADANRGSQQQQQYLLQFDPLANKEGPRHQGGNNWPETSQDSGFGELPNNSPIRLFTESSELNPTRRVSEIASQQNLDESCGVTINAAEKFIVLWSHDANTQNELSLKADVVVEVIRKFDVSGNPEWWLVREPFCSSEGYFPANYLQKL